jgi:hypothetical protein
MIVTEDDCDDAEDGGGGGLGLHRLAGHVGGELVGQREVGCHDGAPVRPRQSARGEQVGQQVQSHRRRVPDGRRVQYLKRTDIFNQTRT